MDASVSQFYPLLAKAVDLSTADADLTKYFPAGFARKIYVGGAGTVILRHIGDAADVTYTAVPQGSWMVGCFTKVTKTGTTATLLVAEA